jgi:ubiquinone/menaquinone biosynthesis C-methylase UbiE
MTKPPASEKIALEFSEKYDDKHAEHYYNQYYSSLSSRISHWREVQIARKALRLAGNPSSVLDLPCGAGRFWPMLAEQPNRTIIGSDNSASMIEMAVKAQPPAVVKRVVQTLQTSAFDINLPDKVVDCIFSMRLMHHIAQPEHRAKMLSEFHRVTRDTVVISLWVDGNYKAWKRAKAEARRAEKRKLADVVLNRLVIPRAQIEAEFKQAGFEIVSHVDFLPFYAMWRIYVLRKV